MPDAASKVAADRLSCRSMTNCRPVLIRFLLERGIAAFRRVSDVR